MCPLTIFNFVESGKSQESDKIVFPPLYPFFQIIFWTQTCFWLGSFFILALKNQKIFNVMSLAFGSFGVYETTVENSSGKQESLMNYAGKGSTGTFSDSTIMNFWKKLKFFEIRSAQDHCVHVNLPIWGCQTPLPRQLKTEILFKIALKAYPGRYQLKFI